MIMKMMNKFLVLVLLFIFCFSSLQSSEKDKGKSSTRVEYEVGYYPPPTPSMSVFCGEIIDLSNYYLRERYDRELLSFLYWHSQIFLMIKRANKFFPVIEAILIEEGVPTDFKYLALIESLFDQRAVSSAKAAGVWQILAETAKEYGLEVTEDVDERYNLEKSTVLACKYLKRTYEQTKNWATAAASYNAGRGRVLSQIEIQKTSDYFDMLFSEETNRYIFRILVAKQIFSEPQKYGFYLKKEDLYYFVDYDIIEVNHAIPNLTDFAKSHGINYQILKDANPWLRTNKLTNKDKKTYQIKIPKKNALKFDSKKIQVYQKNWVINP